MERSGDSKRTRGLQSGILALLFTAVLMQTIDVDSITAATLVVIAGGVLAGLVLVLVTIELLDASGLTGLVALGVVLLALFWTSFARAGYEWTVLLGLGLLWGIPIGHGLGALFDERTGRRSNPSNS